MTVDAGVVDQNVDATQFPYRPGTREYPIK